MSCSWPSTATSRWLLVKFTSGSLVIGWAHVTSFSVTWLPPPASYSPVGAQTHTKPVFGVLQPLPGDFRLNDVTSGHMRWRDVTSCHVTATSCEFQPSRVKRIQNPSFRPSIVTSRWLPVKWRHFRVTTGHVRLLTSFPVTWLPPPASYSPVGVQTYTKPK